jgi:NTE family protein
VSDLPQREDAPTPDSTVTTPARRDDLAIVLDGGGARAAYQVGLLRWLARRYPDVRLPMITGVSAGAINAAFLASHLGPLSATVDDLSRLWSQLTVDQVFRVDAGSLFGNLWHWGLRLISGGRALAPPLSGLVDTSPLRKTLANAFEPAADGTLAGIDRNLEAGHLVGLAIITSSYTTGRTVAWVQGRDIQDWERPYRHSRQTRLTLDHILASGALPMLFPAIQLDHAWYGDGGIRLVTPLSPAVHLGANRILAFSTRFPRTAREAEQPQVLGYPPPAQIAGQLLRAIFIDDHARDALTLQRINALLASLPPDQRLGLRPIDLVLLRPSRDIGRLARQYEPSLPFAFRHLIRGLGAGETNAPDLLSLLMFQPDYLRSLIEIGEADADAQGDEICRLLEGA